MAIQFGFQTYTWQMSYNKYAMKLPHILDVISAAGGKGLEPEVCMLGDYRTDPFLLKDQLEQRNLQLGALCLALDWRFPFETEAERLEADRVIQYLQVFPDTVLTLVQLPGIDRSNLVERQVNALTQINAVSKRAADKGVNCVYHPNSPNGSICRVVEDYKVLLNGIDPEYCGYAPDTGHIAKGGMEVMDVFRAYRPLIRHVHFKDMTLAGKWSAMGEGDINHTGIVQYLHETGYHGWIMVEEESKAAETEPDQVTLDNGTYVQRFLIKDLNRET